MSYGKRCGVQPEMVAVVTKGFEVVSTGERWFGNMYPEGGLSKTLHAQPG